MKINWESTTVVGPGKSANAFQDEKGKLSIIYLPTGSGQPHLITAEVPLGGWESLVYSDPLAIAPDTNVEHINIFQQPDDNLWLVWETKNTHRIAVTPDTGEIYDPESMYRLYYAVDTEKLYMNISETWQFIGSPNLSNLVGFEELTNSLKGITDSIGDITTKLDSVLNKVSTIETSEDYLNTKVVAAVTTLTGQVTEGFVRVEQELDTMATQTANSFVALEGRVTALEEGAPPPEPEIPEEPGAGYTESTHHVAPTGGTLAAIAVGTESVSSVYATPHVAATDGFIKAITMYTVDTSQIQITVFAGSADATPDHTKVLYTSPLIDSVAGAEGTTVVLDKLLAITQGETYWLAIDRRYSTGPTISALTTTNSVGYMCYGIPWTKYTEKLPYKLLLLTP